MFKCGVQEEKNARPAYSPASFNEQFIQQVNHQTPGKLQANHTVTETSASF